MTGTHPDLSLWEDSSETVREELLVHLRGCAACRSAWVAEDPSRIFALLHEAPIPASVLDGVSRAVRTGIEVPALAFPRAAAWAAALLLCAATGWILLQPGQGRPVIAEAPPTAQPRAAHADVELLSSPGDAKLVDLTVGDTQVVMIFDEGLEL